MPSNWLLPRTAKVPVKAQLPVIDTETPNGSIDEPSERIGLVSIWVRAFARQVHMEVQMEENKASEEVSTRNDRYMADPPFIDTVVSTFIGGVAATVGRSQSGLRSASLCIGLCTQ